ncbi:MAG: 1-deoxy-D-xylulose-5-phosphate reductoisomerase, partial [Alphaproteobacteria bacterium]
LDLAQFGQLTFEPPDRDRFPCLALAESAMRQGGAMPIALNAANEVAVSAFLDGMFGFGGIAEVVEEVLGQSSFSAPKSLDEITVIDADSRTKAHAALVKISK